MEYDRIFSGLKCVNFYVKQGTTVIILLLHIDIFIFINEIRLFALPQSVRTSASCQLSLRLGHTAGLTVPRTVIQYRGAASLPPQREPRSLCEHRI